MIKVAGTYRHARPAYALCIRFPGLSLQIFIQHSAFIPPTKPKNRWTLKMSTRHLPDRFFIYFLKKTISIFLLFVNMITKNFFYIFFIIQIFTLRIMIANIFTPFMPTPTVICGCSALITGVNVIRNFLFSDSLISGQAFIICSQ